MTSPRPYTVIPATVSEAAILAEARRRMYEDMGETNAESLDAIQESFERWLSEKLEDGEVIGFVAQACEEDAWLGALSVHVRSVQPSLGNPSGREYYLFGLWVRPRARRQGIASALVSAAVERARDEGVGLVTLMASETGRRVYERMGFEAAPAMRLFLDPMP